MLRGEYATLRNGPASTDGRPYLITAGGNQHWVLKDELHDWLVEHGQDYEFGVEAKPDAAYIFDFYWLVSIPDSKIGTLFKLIHA
jgi:hypothetical protein